MIHIFRVFVLITALSVSACADEVPFSATLVTLDRVLPETAADSREDGVLRDGTGRPVTHALLGEMLPEFAAPLASGETFDSAMLQGQWTVMTIWGVWCHDSRNDLDNIADLAGRLATHDEIGFISLHVPQSADKIDKMYRDHGSLEAFFEDRGISLPTVLDETGDLRARLNIQWTPTYLLIRPDLTVVAYRTDLSKSGEGAVDAFMATVGQLIAD